MGKWILTFLVCFQTVCCKTPAAGTTSSKDTLLPSTCAQSPSWVGVLRLLLCWGLFSPPSPYLLALPSIYKSTPSHSTKHNQKNNSIEPGKIKLKYSPKTCWHKPALASALPDQLQGSHSLSLRVGQHLAACFSQRYSSRARQGNSFPVTLGLGVPWSSSTSPLPLTLHSSQPGEAAAHPSLHTAPDEAVLIYLAP